MPSSLCVPWPFSRLLFLSQPFFLLFWPSFLIYVYFLQYTFNSPFYSIYSIWRPPLLALHYIYAAEPHRLSLHLIANQPTKEGLLSYYMYSKSPYLVFTSFSIVSRGHSHTSFVSLLQMQASRYDNLMPESTISASQRLEFGYWTPPPPPISILLKVVVQ
jgi:hypothetical protein